VTRLPKSASERRRQIFISYRRSDSQSWAGRLADDLRDYFGPDQVYRDLDQARLAHDYVTQIQEALDRSCVVILVLGPEWLSSMYSDGRRRLDDPEDLLRLEIERSLASGIAVVPVLIGNGTMPRADELPTPLRTLARLQAQRLADEDWAYDFGRLIERLERHGVVPSASMTESEPLTTDVKQALTSVRRYERTLQASRNRALDALVSVVEQLRYPRTDEDPRSAQITFTVWARAITAKVIDAGPGHSKVVLEFTAVRTGAAAAGWMALVAVTGGLGVLAAIPGVAGMAALRAQQRRFAVGFLDNVQRVLEGRGIGEDSALLPGVNKWQNRSHEV
jgi:hypothetical protein